jgi:hypothetical protein
MGKRLTRTDYIFTLIFIFMLVCAIAAFFYGLKIGKENTEIKYEALLYQKEEMPLELTAYHQQSLVSFYHTIFLPYRDFQKKWFDHMDSLELRSNTVDPQSIFTELRKLADKQYNEMVSKAMPDASPLLQESHEEYLKSLRLFSEAFKQNQFNNLQGIELINRVEEDTYFQEAKQFALSAQHKYYDAIVKWNQSINPNLSPDEILINPKLTNEAWNRLNLNEKNSWIAFLMKEEQYFEHFYIQDMTIHVDELIENGQADKLNLLNIQQIVNTLISTGAVRTEDFIMNKDRYYENETLPQLPFFFQQK